ncbi:MAG: DUF1983 domain-containing protein, partial [Psychrobium sp.]|nr:DUF1983 domain-containing protein [Psychrobium sp.]
MKKSDFPGIPRSNKRDNVQDAVFENIERLTGARGNDRALLMSDLISLDEMQRRALINSIQSSNTNGLPIVNAGAIEPPHKPVNLTGVGGFTFIALTWDHPSYRGHAYTEVFRSETDVFRNAVLIATEVTDIFSDTVNMGSQYYYWVRFVNTADMKGATQGASGIFVKTQESAQQILGAIGGQIDKGHLGQFLVREIEAITEFPEFEDLAEHLIQEAWSNDLNADVSRADNALVYQKQKTILTEQLASAQKQLLLSTKLNNLSATLVNEYLTTVNTELAIASAITALKSVIEDQDGDSLGAHLYSEYLTKVSTEHAITSATTQLKSTIDTDLSNVTADIYRSVYTKTTTDESIATANQLLKSSIENVNGTSVGASLQVLSKTVANNNGDVWALWGVKTSVAGLMSSVGLVNDGTDPIFAIKGAKFAVITSQDPNKLTPVFSVVNNKTVMTNALIDSAHIQSLVTDSLLSNRILVGMEFKTPSINYNPISGLRSSNFSVDPNGNMFAKSATLESVTIRDHQGNVVMSSTGAIASSKITGLGSFAMKNSLGYGALTGKPSLGALASKNSLSYGVITNKPS